MGGGTSKSNSSALGLHTSTLSYAEGICPHETSSPKPSTPTSSTKPADSLAMPTAQDKAQDKEGKHAPDATDGMSDNYDSDSSDERDDLGQGTDEPLQWKRGELLGSGSFGSVYLARNEATGDLMAVKEIPCVEETVGDIAAFQNEVKLMRSLSHPNIVTYMGSEYDTASNMLYIFTEWVPGGTLEENTRTFGCSEAVAQNYMMQILQGVAYLHERQVIHYDIKPSNVLIDQFGTVKLADFGASRLLSGSSINKSRSMRGTPYYMAPEVIKQETHDTKADIWSIGCTLIKMLTGVPLWKDMKFHSQVALFFHVANLTEPPPLPDTLSSAAKSFILACLQVAPANRWTADQLLNHPFLQHATATSRRHTATRHGHRATTAQPVRQRGKTLTINVEGEESEDEEPPPERPCKTAYTPKSSAASLTSLPSPAANAAVKVYPVTPRPKGGNDDDDSNHLPPATDPRSHGEVKVSSPRIDPVQSPKLPSLTPPKKTPSTPSPPREYSTRRLSLQTKSTSPTKVQRRSLQVSTTGATMPRVIDPPPSQPRMPPSGKQEDESLEQPSGRHDGPRAFDDTPILTDAAKRERDRAIEREEEKRRTKELKEKQWREEQEEYKRSLQASSAAFR
ncbi:hypothetical protein LEN26_009642 [Aphanomyces euteiches]|nr:hypothetical protein AeMF1_021771 [Aphanomyces euteiches]KAH9124922.1 hypothetical protein LEN26_009642 [Aphanomyces euteiches]